MNYINEHLLPGKLGHFFLLLSFVSSIGATLSYFLSVQKNRSLTNGNGQDGMGTAGTDWKKLGRLFFMLECLSVFAVVTILFYIISHHLFEYRYAWQHSSLSLERQYLLSCLWEGQEGSFLLWSIWHCVLGLLIMWKEKIWEGPLLAVIAFVQVILATMLLGFPSLHMGSNPFLLLRNSEVLSQAPAFYDAAGALRQDYLLLLKDGNDLNPLLQNYWMVIHPPVLFLGFASTIVPFAFAVGGLWTKRFNAWAKPALPWTLFSAAVLGTGIMMGAAWAYESLNFGGYWAWDPVENASLVPWLVLVAGLHTLVIYRHTGNALRTTFLFLILAFLFVLYSTYLTRSGDLQDTSVHAFTGEGITKWHLRIFLLLLALPSLALFFSRYKTVPFIAKEEEGSSREFWMFIGSLVLFLSALLIIAMTSIPVFNKVLGLFNGKEKTFSPIALGEDAGYSYNRIQVFVAFIIALLTGTGLFLKYKATAGAFLKRLLVPGVVGLIAGVAVVYFGKVNYEEKTAGFMIAVWVALAAAVFSMVANAVYIFSGLKANLRRAGGAVSHLGFAVLLTGILISSSKKEVLSYNRSGINIPLEENNRVVGKPGENMTLIKGERMDMGAYWVTYEKDSLDETKGDKWFYRLRYQDKQKPDGFLLRPDAFVNHKGTSGLMANPDAKHYLTYDVFTYITSLQNKENNKDTASFRPYTVAVGDTVFYSQGFMTLDKVDVNPVNDKYNFSHADTALMADITVHAKDGQSYKAGPVFGIKNNAPFLLPDSVFSQNLAIAFVGLDAKKVKLQVKESDTVLDFITIKAYKFPFINLVWLGTVLTVIGFLISMFHRRRQGRVSRKSLRIIKAAEKGVEA